MVDIMAAVEADKDRLITVADDSGQLWTMGILPFVVFIIRREYGRQGVLTPTAQQVNDSSVNVTHQLIKQGWFTLNEYREAWISSEMEDLEKELGQL